MPAYFNFAISSNLIDKQINPSENILHNSLFTKFKSAVFFNACSSGDK